MTPSSRRLAFAAADLAADVKAENIVVLELRDVSSVADWFVLASGRSHIQVEAICERVRKGLAERCDELPLAVEGLEQARWAILDYGEVVVHVFQQSVRELYDIERLWSLAPRHEVPEADATRATREADARGTAEADPRAAATA